MDTTSSSRASCDVRFASPPMTSWSVRQRVLQESANSLRQKKRAGRPWSLKPPPPGTSVWDSRRNLEEVPIARAKRKDPPAWDSLSESKGSEGPCKGGHSYPSTSENDPLMEDLERMYTEARSKKRSEPQSYGISAFPGIDPVYLQPEGCPISQEQLVYEVKGCSF